jgi:hypothetical protein
MIKRKNLKIIKVNYIYNYSLLIFEEYFLDTKNNIATSDEFHKL